jgi:hypothetical protein
LSDGAAGIEARASEQAEAEGMRIIITITMRPAPAPCLRLTTQRIIKLRMLMATLTRSMQRQTTRPTLVLVV